MRCSWVEKNRSRNKIDWKRTKNDVRSVVSLFSGNLIHTTTSRGRSGFGGEDLRGGGGFPAVCFFFASHVGGACHGCCCCCLRHVVEHSGLGAGSGGTLGSNGLLDHTCSRLHIRCVELGCSVELGGAKLVDEAPRRMASVGCSGGTCYWGSRSCASESQNWTNHHL